GRWSGVKRCRVGGEAVVRGLLWSRGELDMELGGPILRGIDGVALRRARAGETAAAAVDDRPNRFEEHLATLEARRRLGHDLRELFHVVHRAQRRRGDELAARRTRLVVRQP